MTADDLADLIGEPGALAVRSLYGGTRFYVPRVLEPGHPITIAIGMTLAARLCERYAGDYLEVPRPPTGRALRARIVELWRAGATIREIAFATGCSRRWVQIALRAEVRPDEPRDDRVQCRA